MTHALICLLLTLSLVVPASHGAESVPAPVRALLLTSQSHPIDARMVKNLEQAGVRMLSRPLVDPLSQAILRQFHLVMLIDFEGLQPPGLWDPDHIAAFFTVKQNLVELQRYVEAGGGLWYSMSVGTAGVATAQAMEDLFSPWGVSLVPANVRDDAHTADNYCWTTAIARSPVTAGVERLYYPNVQGRWDDVYSTMPFVLRDKRWQAVVSAMPTAITARRLQYKSGAGPAWYPHPSGAPGKPPVLAAIGRIGKGRVGLFAVHRLYTFLYPYDAEVKGWEYASGRVDGAVLSTGDGKTPSDGLRLITHTLQWLAEPARDQGWGTYTPESYAALPMPAKATTPAWLGPWTEKNGTSLFKVLIGVHSAASNGRGTVAEFAQAARQAGYSVLITTEDLATFPPARWDSYYRECAALSGPDLQVIAGLDIEDEYQNHYLLWGQSVFPATWMLTPDGRRMTEIQYLNLGMGLAFAVIARPGSTPLPHQLYKHYSGLAVFTYRDGELIDNGLPAYQVQIHNMSLPFPVAVHEVFDPTGVATAAGGGHQVYIPADTAANAAWYLRAGTMQHYYEVPNRVVVSSGPMIRALDAGKGHASFTNLVVDDDQPITEVCYYAQYELLRRWTPNSTRFEGLTAIWPGSRKWGFLWIRDAKGRTAITPGLRTGQGYGFDWRCSDRQNFFATVISYAGNGLAGGVDVSVPTFGTEEGSCLWPSTGGPLRGENLAPLIEFPYFSPALSITDAWLDQRYTKALFEEVGFDARPAQGTTRSRVYDGRVRYFDFHNLPAPVQGQKAPSPLMLTEIELRLKQPVNASGELFPALLRVGPQPQVRVKDKTGAWTVRKLTNGTADLPVGGSAGDLVALAPGLRVSAGGWVGIAPPAVDRGALPAGTAWRASWVRIGAERDMEATVKALGVAAVPVYGLDLRRGAAETIAYVARLTADEFGVAGEVRPDPAMTYRVPLRIAGLSPHWPTGLWRAAPENGGVKYDKVPGDPADPETRTTPEQDLVPFGVFEQAGWALLDVTRGGPFYAGHLVTAGESRLRIGLLTWTDKEIVLELNNPTALRIVTTVRTPSEITNRFRLEKEVTVDPGALVRVRFAP